jgi:hypothetical protein
VIVSAVESHGPLRRYLVGADALMVAGAAFLPRVLTDAPTRLATGLRRRALEQRTEETRDDG